MAKILRVPPVPPPSFFSPIVDLVRQDGVLAVGTESSYALAASISRPHALERVALMKGRPPGKPLLVLIAERSRLDSLAESVPSWTHGLLNEFWPGPLTVIVSARPTVSSALTAGTGTIGVRVPGSSFLRSLLQRTGPLTGTSANRSGDAPCLTAEAVDASLGTDVDWILDTGPASGAPPSTLLSVVNEPVVLRPGPVTAHDLQRVLSRTGRTVEIHDVEPLH